ERRLERLADLAIGVADERAQLAQRGLEVLALAPELLDVGQGLGVLLLRERVDRTELLAAPAQALDARAQLLGGLLVERLGRRGGLEPQPLGELGQVVVGLGGGVARLL